jgi:hypothetical protein
VIDVAVLHVGDVDAGDLSVVAKYTKVGVT